MFSSQTAATADGRAGSRGQGIRAQHAAVAEHILRETEDEQNLRQAMAELPPRCRELVQMLFYDEPVRPYQEIAAILGIAVGSIGFIRQRCLERLRKRLLEAGFA